MELSDVKDKINQAFKLREEYETAKKRAGELYAELQFLQGKIMGVLEEQEMDSLKTNLGTFSFRIQENFSLKRDQESRDQFFKFLKDKGVFEQIITVHARTLDAFAKSEAEAAEAEGNFDYLPPGLSKSHSYKPTMRVTKK